jgi:hypothetical protein
VRWQLSSGGNGDEYQQAIGYQHVGRTRRRCAIVHH